MAAADPIRSKKEVKQMAKYYLEKGQLRNYLLIIMGVHTALRISDLLRLTWDDVYDFERQKAKQYIHIIEKKTGKPKSIALNKEAIQALARYAALSNQFESGRFLFESNRKNRAAISRVQAYRIIRTAAEATALQGTISCHSLRKTFGYHAWKSGAPVAVIMDIYNHTSFAITRRYLGVCQDDRDEVYLRMSFT